MATWWQRLIWGTRRLQARPDWDLFAGTDWANSIMHAAVTDRFHAKQGRSTGRWVLHQGDSRLAVYLKRHYQLSRWRGLLAALWPGGNWSPATQEWHHLERARALGVPVPRTVAVGEYLGPWGRLQSFLAVEELTDMLPLHEAIPLASSRLSPRAFADWKRRLIAEIVRIVRLLHDGRWFHKDLYLCHFFIHTADTEVVPQWAGRVHLIDLHRLARHGFFWRLWQVKDLAQLLYSSHVAGVTVRDQLRFWHAYHDCPGETAADWLRNCIVWKGLRYRRHNEKKAAQRSGGGPA